MTVSGPVADCGLFTTCNFIINVIFAIFHYIFILNYRLIVLTAEFSMITQPHVWFMESSRNFAMAPPSNDREREENSGEANEILQDCVDL